MNIKFLRAFYGDSIHISYKDDENRLRNVLIDGGPGKTWQYLYKKDYIKPGDLQLTINKIRKAKQKIDLLVLTHVDDDHIVGILKWFSEDKCAPDLIEKIWFNSGRLIAEHFHTKEIKENLLKFEIGDDTHTGIRNGVIFEDFVEEHDLWERRIIKAGNIKDLYGAEITILSPDDSKLKVLQHKWKSEHPGSFTGSIENDYDKSLAEHIKQRSFKEDNSKHNGSSIAFVLRHKEKSVLMLGDAHPTIIINSLRSLRYSKDKPLRVDLVKVSHHGSKANTPYELLELIDCQKFIISADGTKDGLPHKQCLARIINSRENVILYFNYEHLIEEIFSEQDRKDFKFETKFIRRSF